MEKLGVAGTASLVRYGVQHHLFEEHATQSAWMLEDVAVEPGSATAAPLVPR
jgi:hypothetical protein